MQYYFVKICTLGQILLVVDDDDDDDDVDL